MTNSNYYVDRDVLKNVCGIHEITNLFRRFLLAKIKSNLKPTNSKGKYYPVLQFNYDEVIEFLSKHQAKYNHIIIFLKGYYESMDTN